MKLHSKFKKLMLGAVLLACTSFTTANAVVIELALVLDGSGSISGGNFTLQTSAYNNIFSSGTFVDDFVNSADQLYVSAFQFSGNGPDVVQEIGWTLLNDNAAATVFGGMFPGITQDFGTTPTAAAVQTAAASILGNGFGGGVDDRMIIDISTDGVPFGGINPSQAAIDAAADAFADGIIVNAIGVGGGVNAAFLDPFTTAGGGFFVTAATFGDFQDVLEDKLETEIGGGPTTSVPEPSSILLLGVGMLGLISARKKKLI